MRARTWSGQWVYDRAPMLPREFHGGARPDRAPRTTLSQLRATGRRWPREPATPSLTRWLKAPGSLTARLRRHGHVTVQVIRQGTRRLNRAEQMALGQVSAHVREVLLRVDGEPMVWARSTTSHRALKGPWKALKGLGNRPLAELLFSHAQVSRGPLHLHRNSAGKAPRWGRASIFLHHGHPLRVMESFSPRIQCWRP